MFRYIVLLATAFLAALAVGAPSIASAEVGTDQHDALVPVNPSGASGGATTMSTPMGSTFACNQSYSIVQALPSGFVVGNCLYGTHLRRQLKSDPYSTSFPSDYWDGGWIFGSYSGCGWINSGFSNLAGSTTETLCGTSVGMSNATYQQANNNGTNEAVHGSCSWSAGRCTDGTPVYTAYPCGFYANFRPWTNIQTPTDEIRGLPAGTLVKWRYVTKYDYPDQTGQKMVMVRDPAYTAGNGNWGFMHISCFSSLPGLTFDVS